MTADRFEIAHDIGEANTVGCPECPRSAKEYPVGDGTVWEYVDDDTDRVCFALDHENDQLYAYVHTVWDVEAKVGG